MKKLLTALMLTAVCAVTLTGCFQAPQAEPKQPEQKTEVKDETVTPPAVTIIDYVDPTTSEQNTKYEYDDAKGVLVDLTDNSKVLYTNPGHPDSVLAILGMEGDKLIVWETGMDNSPGPCYWDEIWTSDMEKSHIKYLDLKNLSTGLQPYTIPESKYNQEKIDVEACSNGLLNDADANQLAQKIEGDTEWAVDYYKYDENTPIFATCNEGTKALSDSLKDTKVGFMSLFGATDIITYNYDINLIRTANPDQLTKEQLSSMINECSGLGSNQVLMATKDAIYWGYPYCSAGAVPTPESDGYKDYQDCLVVQNQVAEYFGIEILADESTLTIAEKLADFEKYSSPTTADIIYGCNTKADDLNTKLKNAGVQAFPVYNSAIRNIEIYKTANPDKMTKAELEEIASTCQEGGSNEVLKATDDYIIWGNPVCDLGPDADATECVAATNAVSAYFK